LCDWKKGTSKRGERRGATKGGKKRKIERFRPDNKKVIERLAYGRTVLTLTKRDRGFVEDRR
jgi:hypothetical protein